MACGDSDGGESNTPPPGVNTIWLGDWNDENDDKYKPEYQGNYNPICDEWKVIKKNGQVYNDLLLYRFLEGKAWHTATRLDVGKPLFQPNWGSVYYNKYKINDKQIKFTDDKIFEYKLTVSETEDKLQIYDGRDTWELIPYTDSWTWKGDWNDILDRHYTAYQGKYNPLAGTWKYTHEDGKPVSENISHYYIFDQDTTLIYRTEDNTIDKYTYKYEINSSSLKRYNSMDNYSFQYKYNVDIDTLYLYYMAPKAIVEYRYLRIK